MVDNKLILCVINLNVKEVVSSLNPDGTKLANRNVMDKIDAASQLTNPILVFIELN